MRVEGRRSRLGGASSLFVHLKGFGFSARCVNSQAVSDILGCKPQAVQSLLADADTAREMGKAARASTEQNFDLDHVINEFQDVFQKVEVP
ncbi:hypothetical protein [Roseinatronobacter sp. S2]|uniref:hypothetical protein n=1 Tax=Roseinatronobacter sp. S2 TaxID=3035471 RepID=UPI0024105024|nr:hypothetical protein [Roseinatronobacter sp. S2]WFE75347.1 hypothetical protein P8S53_02790 [Roseinatronobacter sp. S2]